jgi:hypothetical protein
MFFYQYFQIGPSNSNIMISILELYKNIDNLNDYEFLIKPSQYPDKFQLDTQLLKPDLIQVNIQRLDISEGGWGQNLGIILVKKITRSEMSNLVTAYISTSPRIGDPHNTFDLIKKTYDSFKQYDVLKDIRVVVCCDGRRPNTTDASWNAYQEKLKLMKSHNWNAELIEMPEWYHQANNVKAGMKTNKTPIVFFIEDDSHIFGDINFNLIINTLMEDINVEFIKFYQRPTFDNFFSNYPGTFHSSEFLRLTHDWSGRPHFALEKHYFNRVWTKCYPHTRNVIENLVVEQSRNDKNFGLWIYSPVNDVTHENFDENIATTLSF